MLPRYKSLYQFITCSGSMVDMSSVEKSIIVLAGLPFTGKTTLGQKMSEVYGIPFFDIDEARHEIMPTPDNRWHGPEEEREIMMAAYIHNHEKAGEALKSGCAVILAATYSRNSYHEMLRELAQKHNVGFWVFLLEIPDSLVPSRLQERLRQASSSNIVTIESYDEVKSRYKPFEGEELVHVDTSQSIQLALDTIGGHLLFQAS